MNKLLKIVFISGLLVALGLSNSIYSNKTKKPPEVPHTIDSAFENCLECHEKGKEVDGKKAPVTPHPKMVKCVACHKPVKK